MTRQREIVRIDLDANVPNVSHVQADLRDAAAEARDKTADARDAHASDTGGDGAALDRAMAARDRLSAALDRWGAALDRQRAAERDQNARDAAAVLADTWWKRITAVAASFATTNEESANIRRSAD
jgi:hypothetical protein